MPPPASRIALPQLTLCAVSSVNIDATVRALEASLEQIDVAAALLLTDRPIQRHHAGIEVVKIAPIASSHAYSDFVLTHLVDHVATSHCLVVQWDGHVIDAARWRPDFLNYDYIGARWPQFAAGHDVGNGGFSLRSRKLMEACRDPAFRASHPEDVAIGRINRDLLERQGMRFAPSAIADLFSTERAGDIANSFGYHGAWLMPRVMGVESFWRLYHHLDDSGTIRHDFSKILKQIMRGPGGRQRAIRLMLDQIFHRGGR